jgi:hypothetical protein
MNAEVAAWMRRDPAPDVDSNGIASSIDSTGSGGGGGGTAAEFASPPFLALGDNSAVVWNRDLSVERYRNPADRARAQKLAQRALDAVGAKRLVVGHTPQMRGANVELGGLVWRIDAGMSGGVLDAPAAVLEITGTGDAAECRVIEAGGGAAYGAGPSIDEPLELVEI